MKKLCFTLFLILGLVSLLNAQWVSPGNGTNYSLPDLVVASNGAVTSTGTVFSFNSDITISENDVLTIDNKVTRIDAPGVLITIKGSIACNNEARVGIYGAMAQNQQFSMRFENATNCELKTLYFSDGCGIKLIESDVRFIDCKFVYFTRDYSNAVIDFMNCNPLIEDCYFLRNEGAAISSPANGQGSPKILNSRFEENVTSDLNSPQINLGPGAEDTIFIVGNNIDDDYASHRVGGISVADLMGTGSTTVLLKDNYVVNGRYGYNQQGLTISSVIEQNQFVNNHFEDNPTNGGSGISIYGMNENNKAVLRNNIITGNLWGITVINAADVNLGTENEWGNNQIKDNGNGGVIYDLYNNSTSDIMAVGNDWGSTNEAEIEDHIVHQLDDSSLGLVTFLPFVGYDVIEEPNASSFAVWPIPAQGRFMVEGHGKITIANALGQIFLNHEINGKESIELPRGLYIVKIGNTTQKVIVE